MCKMKKKTADIPYSIIRTDYNKLITKLYKRMIKYCNKYLV